MRSKIGFCRFFLAAVLLPVLLMPSSAMAQSSLEAEIADIIQQAVPSVVTIRADVPMMKSEQNSLSFFSQKPAQQGGDEKRYILVGSGLYLNDSGFIATRSSVVKNASIVYVRLWNGEETRADVIGIDNEKGIALLKIDSPQLPTLNYAQTKSLSNGSMALVIGNSLGISPAISVGNISSRYKDGFIQISANIDPGANGAPVLDANGNVLGIVTGRIAYNKNENEVIPSGSTVLVVPIEEIYKSAEAICKTYQRDHGWIGLTVLRSQYSLVNPQIRKVAPDSPAEKAGLKVGDVILRCNDKEFDDYYSLRSIVKDARAGDKLELEVLRGQQNVKVSLQVGSYDYASLFESVPYVDSPAYTDDSRDGARWQWNLKGQNSVETRLRQMELEIQSLRKQLRYQQKK